MAEERPQVGAELVDGRLHIYQITKRVVESRQDGKQLIERVRTEIKRKLQNIPGMNDVIDDLITDQFILECVAQAFNPQSDEITCTFDVARIAVDTLSTHQRRQDNGR